MPINPPPKDSFSQQFVVSVISASSSGPVSFPLLLSPSIRSISACAASCPRAKRTASAAGMSVAAEAVAKPRCHIAVSLARDAEQPGNHPQRSSEGAVGKHKSVAIGVATVSGDERFQD